MKKNYLFLVIMTFVFFLGMQNLEAQIFLKLDGIQGSSTYKGSSGWIKIESYNSAVDRPVDVSGRTGGATKVKPIVLAKLFDKSSTGLMASCLNGAVIKSGTIHFVKNGTNVFAEMQLENIHIASFTMSSEASSPPIEEFSLVFGKFKLRNYQDRSEAGWDVAGNRRW